jgi:hypothetical protein
LPSVAFSRPPTASPVFAATASVAWLSSAASGTMARTASTNKIVCASGAAFSATSTIGTTISNQSNGLCLISSSRDCMVAPFGGRHCRYRDHARCLDTDRTPDLDHRLLSNAGITPVGEFLVRHEEKREEYQDPENGSDHHTFLPRAQSRLRW